MSGRAVHQHEDWQIRESASGGFYCAACGQESTRQASASPSNEDKALAAVDEGRLVAELYAEFAHMEQPGSAFVFSSILHGVRAAIRSGVIRDVAELVRAAKAEALEEAADEFHEAALAGIEPELNLLAAKILRRRAAGRSR